MCHETYSAASEPEVIVLASSWSVAPCLALVLSEGLFLQPEWPEVCYGTDSFNSGKHNFP